MFKIQLRKTQPQCGTFLNLQKYLTDSSKFQILVFLKKKKQTTT